MTGVMIIAGLVIVVGVILYLFDRKKMREGAYGTDAETEAGTTTAGSESGGEIAETTTNEENGICCGTHAICEKQNAAAVAELVYYDDEELDALSGRDPKSYTEEEMEQLRDVVLTLRREDAVGWSVSLQRRGIALPDEIRDELMLLIS